MDAVPLKVQPAIPMVDLQAQFASIGAEVRAAIDEVLAAQHFILGPQLATFEQDVARLCNRRLGIGVASGTDALLLALRASGIGHGDDVIVPAFTFIATASAVSALDARPVFADIEPRTFNLDPAQLESKITSKTRAIIAVHLYGLPADMDPILAIANRRRLRVIEDNAQAIGASYKQRKTGSLGEVGCLSFYPSKNLGAYGDAGMIVTDSEELAARLKMLRHHGQSRKYVSDEPGWNSRLDEIQAAVLRVKLRHLEQWTAARQAHAARYTELLSGIRGLVTPTVPEGCTHVFHQYTIRVPERDGVQRALAERGIASTVYYPVPLHLQPVYGALGCKRGNLPEAERAAAEALSLPMYPELTSQQIERVTEGIAAALQP
jgi:dTDP-4-amino-4,6-dideoxygalactose transaminase